MVRYAAALFPEIPGRYITAKIELEDGAPITIATTGFVCKLSQAMDSGREKPTRRLPIDKSQPVVNLLAWSDGYGEVEVTAELTNESLTVITEQFADQPLARKRLGVIEGAYSTQFSAAEEPAGGTFINGVFADDRELASRVSEQLADTLASLKGVSDVYDDGQDGLPQVRLVLNQYGQQLGLTQATH